MNHTQLLIDILIRLVIADIRVLTLLAGYRDSSVCRKKLKDLIVDGKVTKLQSGRGHLLYTLSEKGLAEAGLKRKPYTINQNTYHEEMVGYAAAFLYIVAGLSIYDMNFDRTQRNHNKPTEVLNIPDIVYTNENGKTRCVEVEITLKERTRLEEKVVSLAQNYDGVRFIYPEERTSIRNSICRLMSENYINDNKCKFTTLQHVIDKVNGFDLKKNGLRFDIKGA